MQTIEEGDRLTVLPDARIPVLAGSFPWYWNDLPAEERRLWLCDHGSEGL